MDQSIPNNIWFNIELIWKQNHCIGEYRESRDSQDRSGVVLDGPFYAVLPLYSIHRSGHHENLLFLL